MSLTISPSKTEVFDFHRQSLDSELTRRKLLLVSAAFKFLDLIFHQSGELVPAFQKLSTKGHQNSGSHKRSAAHPAGH